MSAESIKLKRPRILYLDIIRTIAIISISLNHVVNDIFNNYANQSEEFYSSSVLITIFKTTVNILSHIGVPLFLMITGALILNKKMDTGEDVKRFYKNNLLSIFITTEIWYFIYFWAIYIAYPTLFDMESAGIGEAVIACIKTLLFIDVKNMGSMWYMPMILCVYTILPIFIVAVKKIPNRFFILPLTILALSSMIFPAINNFLWLYDKPTLSFALVSDYYMFSMYFLFIFAGYFISNGALDRIKTPIIVSFAILIFSLSCVYQFFAYSQTKDLLLGYDFPGFFIVSALVFELCRRYAHRFEKISGVFCYVSKISFAIYFVHVLILRYLIWLKVYQLDLNRIFQFVILWSISFFGSILVIAVLSKIKFFKRYLFLIKD